MYRVIKKGVVVAMKLMNLMSKNVAVGNLLSVSSACCQVGHLRTAITAAGATLCRHTGLTKGSVSQTFFKWGPLSLFRMFYGPPYSWDYQTH